MAERLRIEGLYKIFGGAPAPAMALLADGANKDKVFADTGLVVGLNNVSMSVASGSTHMIMGLSGSGKSTLARCINRLNEPSAGRILLDGADIVAMRADDLREVRRTRISMVFQHFALLPHKNVIENIEFGLKLRDMAPKQRRQRAEQVLGVVGLANWGYHYPHELSGGMRQRVGLARALATDADVLIMDEAFSALDPLIRSEMQDELLRLQRTLQKTIVFITHDFQEALKLGTQIAIMSEGELVREGTPQSIVLEPGSDHVAAFTRDVDRSRLFDARSIMADALALTLSADGGATGGAEASILFLVDTDRTLLGVLAGGDLVKVRQGAPVRSLVSKDYVAVAPDTKLIDVARVYQAGKPVAVVDDRGRLLGSLGPDEILAQIATRPEASGSARHV